MTNSETQQNVRIGRKMAEFMGIVLATAIPSMWAGFARKPLWAICPVVAQTLVGVSYDFAIKDEYPNRSETLVSPGVFVANGIIASTSYILGVAIRRLK